MKPEDEDNVKDAPQGKQPRSAADIRKSIETQLRDARVKEATDKAKKLVSELVAAKKVVSSKEDELAQMFAEYDDVIPQ